MRNIQNNETGVREYAVELTALLAQLSLKGVKWLDNALPELSEIMWEAAKAGEAAVACSVIGDELGGEVLWHCVQRAEKIEAHRIGAVEITVGGLRDTYIPALASAAASWVMRNELPAEEPLMRDLEEGASVLTNPLSTRNGQYRTAVRVADVISWGAYSLERAELIAEKIGESPRRTHLPLLRQYLVLCGPEATLELIAAMEDRLLPFAVETARNECREAA